jgi:hypothetical protein
VDIREAYDLRPRDWNYSINFDKSARALDVLKGVELTKLVVSNYKIVAALSTTLAFCFRNDDVIQLVCGVSSLLSGIDATILAATFTFRVRKSLRRYLKVQFERLVQRLDH